MKVSIPYPTILNELSFEGTLRREEFVALIKNLVGVVRAMRRFGYGQRFAYSKDVMLRPAFACYTFTDWLVGAGKLPKAEREWCVLVRAMFANGQALEDSGITSDEDFYLNGDLIYGGGASPIPGFVASYIWGLPSVALNTGQFSEHSDFSLEREFYLKDGTFYRECVVVQVLSTLQDVATQENNLMIRLLADLQNGVELISACEEIMPRLSFSSCVKIVLRTISCRQFPVIGEFLKLHNVFERCLDEHTNDFYNTYGPLNSIAMSESDTKMAAHPHCRDFKWDDGTVRECQPHVKVGNGCRIHFLPDFSDGKLYVGYVGAHLEP